jgi:hypothetical protein
MTTVYNKQQKEEVLTAVVIKISVLWNTMPNSPLKTSDVLEEYVATIFRVEGDMLLHVLTFNELRGVISRKTEPF